MDYETALSNLEALIQWAKDNNAHLTRNEAATRFQLIDRLLQDCLGWPVNRIDVERFHEGEYTDYEIGIPAKRLVIEAKREGKYFELPAGSSKLKYRIKTLYEMSDDIRLAMQQAMGYCQTRGIPLGAVANGHQLIVFISNRQDGIPPEDGLALVFESLDEMRSAFIDLWNSLSPSGLDSRFIFTLLLEQSVTPPPEKLTSRILDYPGYKNRNPVAAELQILGGLFLEDITRMPEHEEEFVRETYCESGALSQYALVSKEILSSRYTSYFEKETKVSVKPVRTKKGVQPELKEDLLAASLSQRPIILIGDIGVGKSMFTRHLILVDAKDALKEAIVLYLDFGNKPALARELSEYVMREFERQLRDIYSIDIQERNFVRGVYHSELIRFSKGIYSDLREKDPATFQAKEINHLSKLLSTPEQHLKSCIQHIVSAQKRQVVIFLDNVDQRPLEFQEQVFLIAQSLAQTWPVTTFVALRPDTFAHSRASGSLSAYQPRVFVIDPPRVDRVVQKRLRYALEQLKASGRLPSFPKGVTVNSEKLENYIEMLGEAFENSDEIIRFVDNMSNGNLRKALDFIVAFVGSGHVDSEKIFRIIGETDRYTLPLHEFLRAVIFRDNEYFDPLDAPVLNVYDITSTDRREHFLTLLLISFVERTGVVGGSEGFVSLQDIYHYLQGLGFSERQIQSAIERVVNKDLIASPSLQPNMPVDRFRVSASGAYTSKKLANMFTYVDAVIVDTPIIDSEFRNRIQPVNTIEERLDRALIFASYLDQCWDIALSGVYDWPFHASSLRGEVASIKSRIEQRAFDREDSKYK
jgi:hypothetical protein